MSHANRPNAHVVVHGVTQPSLSAEQEESSGQLGSARPDPMHADVGDKAWRRRTHRKNKSAHSRTDYLYYMIDLLGAFRRDVRRVPNTLTELDDVVQLAV